MPVRSLSDAEIERLTTWPPEVARSDLVAHFTLALDDLRWARSFRGAANRLGLAVQLCGLRFLGYIPTDLVSAPKEVVVRLAERLGAAPSALGRYEREAGERLRREHAALVVERAGWTSCGQGEWKALDDWLVARALEHDTAPVLFRQTLDHPLAKALVEHGKLLRTLHALRWFTDEAFRRRIGRQLNRGEALNDLRRFLSFGHRGHVRHRHHDDQTMQAHCLTLVTNACVLSTTRYLAEAVDTHRADGYGVSDAVIAHLSPARFESINPYGAYTIDVAAVLNRTTPRPLRQLSRPGGTTS